MLDKLEVEHYVSTPTVEKLELNHYHTTKRWFVDREEWESPLLCTKPWKGKVRLSI